MKHKIFAAILVICGVATAWAEPGATLASNNDKPLDMLDETVIVGNDTVSIIIPE